jgi:hypothetical protein
MDVLDCALSCLSVDPTASLCKVPSGFCSTAFAAPPEARNLESDFCFLPNFVEDKLNVDLNNEIHN